MIWILILLGGALSFDCPPRWGVLSILRPRSNLMLLPFSSDSLSSMALLNSSSEATSTYANLKLQGDGRR